MNIFWALFNNPNYLKVRLTEIMISPSQFLSLSSLSKNQFLGTCLKSITNHEETILKVDLNNNDDVKETISLLENNIKETKNPNIIIILN